jgi:hypothetical protein
MDIGMLLFVMCFAVWQVLTLNQSALATPAGKTYARAILHNKINNWKAR